MRLLSLERALGSSDNHPSVSKGDMKKKGTGSLAESVVMKQGEIVSTLKKVDLDWM